MQCVFQFTVPELLQTPPQVAWLDYGRFVHFLGSGRQLLDLPRRRKGAIN